MSEAWDGARALSETPPLCRLLGSNNHKASYQVLKTHGLTQAQTPRLQWMKSEPPLLSSVSVASTVFHLESYILSLTKDKPSKTRIFPHSASHKSSTSDSKYTLPVISPSAPAMSTNITLNQTIPIPLPSKHPKKGKSAFSPNSIAWYTQTY